jgi:hypothetical protein
MRALKTLVKWALVILAGVLLGQALPLAILIWWAR